MKNVNEGFIIGIGLLLAAMLFTARLIAMKTNHDPIMNRYKPGTVEYKMYQKLVNSRKFMIMLVASISVVLLLAGYVVLEVCRLVNTNSHDTLLFGAVSGVLIFVVSIVVTYYLIIKNILHDK